jgi:glutamine---fructose-6-phosphate transaminase (isomerizing)
MSLHHEIHEQPAVLARLLETGGEAVQRVAEAIRTRGVEFVYLAARGTSEHAGIYGQYLLGLFHGLGVALAAPSLFTVYQRPPRLSNALVIGISQSGQSPDIVAVLEEGRRQGALTLALTNDQQSPLAQAAELALAIGAGPERAVAATKTYSATLLTLAMLSVALDDRHGLRAGELRRVPQAVAAALDSAEEAHRLAASLAAMERCVVLGRGLNHATALEWALKLKELAQVVADPYSTAAFLHGPIALIDEDVPVLAIAPNGAIEAETEALLAKLERDHNATVVAITNTTNQTGSGRRLVLSESLPEWLSPISAIVPAQLFCYHLALARGLNPDAPRALRKVTLTR